ncbi:MAG: hypothetical protein U1D97_13845 [Desulfuromonadales bacterium]|nr:hypothetical protein [Desulfuromonadales bacterium]
MVPSFVSGPPECCAITSLKATPSDGSKRLADNALVALTLLIAESRPEEKETIVKVIVNLINRSND